VPGRLFLGSGRYQHFCHEKMSMMRRRLFFKDLKLKTRHLLCVSYDTKPHLQVVSRAKG
jgi:hypothetical protein